MLIAVLSKAPSQIKIMENQKHKQQIQSIKDTTIFFSFSIEYLQQ